MVIDKESVFILFLCLFFLALFCAFLCFCLRFRTGLLRVFGSCVVRADSPLLKFNANAIFAGFNDDVLTIDVNNLADNAADCGDLVAFL